MRGSDVKWHIPSTCLDASKKVVSIGIYGINRAFEWLWLETEETPYNGQNVHGFQVRTPISTFGSFEKGLADRGGCREEILPLQEIEASFLYPLSYALRRRGTHYWRTF